jgi:hypothetical protein
MNEAAEHYSFQCAELAVLMYAYGAENTICFEDVTAADEETSAKAEVRLLADGFLVEEDEQMHPDESLDTVMIPMAYPVAILTLTTADIRYSQRIYYIREEITLLERNGAGGCILSTLSRDGFVESVLQHPTMVFGEEPRAFLTEQRDNEEKNGAILPAETPAEQLLINGIFLMECWAPNGERKSWLRGYYDSLGPKLELCGRNHRIMEFTEERLAQLLKSLWRSESP